MTIRLGLAGLGVHGRRYANHLLAGDVPGGRLTAVCRRDEIAGAAFAREHGLAYVDRPEELATHPDVDAVVLVLPPDLHPSVAEACLTGGRPVLVEKPLAPDARQAAHVAAVVAATGGTLMMAHTLRFDAVVQELQRLRETIGELRLVSINQRFEPSMRPWIDTPGRGGMFLNTGIHGFDLLRHLTGLEATSIAAEARRTLTEKTEDQFVATLRLEPGPILAVIDNSRSTHSRSGRIELVGEDGQLWGDHIHRTLDRVAGRNRESLGPVAERPTVPATLRSFVDCIAEDRPPAIDVNDGVAALEMVDAATRSAEIGRPVRIEEIRSATTSRRQPAGRSTQSVRPATNE